MDSSMDYYTRPFTPVEYPHSVCKRQLMLDFRQLYECDINSILTFFGGQYAKTHRALRKVMEELKKIAEFDEKSKRNKPCIVKVRLHNDQDASKVFEICRMPALRNTREPRQLPQSLQLEMDFVYDRTKDRVNSPLPTVEDVSTVEDVPINTNIECVCCCGDFEFELMVQCADGHLICKDCLNSYIKEKIYGSGKFHLECLASNCSTSYPVSELRRCLTPDIIEKLEERGMAEDLTMAGITDLISCPDCKFTAQLSPTAPMFLCRNLDCQKAICRSCQTDWNIHNGLTCEEVKEKDEATLRKEYEEKMTLAKVRTCQTCRTEFLKENGCNKLICRCGTTMCYVCRMPKIDYNHFCRHPRDPGQTCTNCKACSLWSNVEEDERRAIEEIRNEASAKRRLFGYEEKLIGAPLTPKKINQK